VIYRPFVFAAAVTTTILAGCGGSQPPIGALGALSQTSALASHAGRGKSWMLPGTSSGDLIYATGGCGGACVLSYPEGRLVESVSISVGPTGLGGGCSDSAGNVFITNDAEVLEYAHGGTSPISTLSLPGNEARACAIDPRTGDLAVVFTGISADVAIFPNAQGTPSQYDSHLTSLYCGYDNAGNLFVSGYSSEQVQLVELPSGSGTFNGLSISHRVGQPGQVQWDGNYITYESRGSDDIKVSRLVISGSRATIVGSTHFKGGLRNANQSSIYGNVIVIPYSIRAGRVNKLGLWAYPKDGKSVRKFGNFGQGKLAQFMGVTVSRASSQN